MMGSGFYHQARARLGSVFRSIAAASGHRAIPWSQQHKHGERILLKFALIALTLSGANPAGAKMGLLRPGCRCLPTLACIAQRAKSDSLVQKRQEKAVLEAVGK